MLEAGLGLAITALLTVIALGSLAVLVDCWVRGRFLYEQLQHESALLDSGYLPMRAVKAPSEQRLRRPLGFDALATCARKPALHPVSVPGEAGAFAPARPYQQARY